MKLIRLTKGKVAMVDDADFAILNNFKWHAVYKCRNWYARTGFHVGRNKSTTIYMHHFILPWRRGHETDHQDGDGLNNQRNNLRKCRRCENRRNQHRVAAMSGLKGCHWHKRDRRWYANIQNRGKLQFLGSYKTKREAALAYDAAARKYYGEFACTNYKEAV